MAARLRARRADFALLADLTKKWLKICAFCRVAISPAMWYYNSVLRGMALKNRCRACGLRKAEGATHGQSAPAAGKSSPKGTRQTTPKKLEKKLKKGVDKKQILCYNKDVPRGEDTTKWS